MGLFDSLFGPSADEVSSASNRGRRQWNPLRRPIYDWEQLNADGQPITAAMKKREAEDETAAAAKRKIAEETKKATAKAISGENFWGAVAGKEKWKR